MPYYFRISEETRELTLVGERRKSRDASGEDLEELALDKLNNALLAIEPELKSLRKLLVPGEGERGHGHLLNFRRSDLKDLVNRAAIERGVRKWVSETMDDSEQDAGVALIMKILDVRAERKDIILAGIAEGTANRMAEVLDQSPWEIDESEEAEGV